MVELILDDCMNVMKDYEDNYFDLAIVDPPYGIARFGNRVEISDTICKEAKINKWDIKPKKEYFNELFRVSKKQIIWGANNFTLPETEYFIVWDKMQSVDNFASAEYAWTNCKKPAKVFRYSIHQVMSDRKKENGKIHPTQKPVKLYEWLLHKYSEKGQKILDTHLGSGSIAIACYYFGCDLVGIEIDEEYYNKAKQRINELTKQKALW
tara:strand:+ start:1592 stop:2218 length:627 start_codon:yes stop_codon:yes gene_type:complete